MTETDIERIRQTPMNFVMGRERSGTTLLQVMLNTHRDVFAPTESRFIMLWYSSYGSISVWTEKRIRQFINDVFTERLFANFWNIDKESLIQFLLPLKQYLDYPLICKLVYYYGAQGKEVKLFIDKNPIYYHFLNELGEIYPQAKYIHIVRDYRDNILSHQKVFALKNTAYVAYHWVRINEMMEEAKRKSPDKWITVKYESLVTDPANSLDTIYKFLGLPFDKSMIKPHEENIPKGFLQHSSNPRTKLFHEKLYKPLDPSRIDEWKSKMPAKDLSIAEAIAGNMGEKIYGYKLQLEPEQATVSFFNMLRAKFMYSGIRALARAAFRWPWLYSFIRSFWRTFMMKSTSSK